MTRLDTKGTGHIGRKFNLFSLNYLVLAVLAIIVIIFLANQRQQKTELYGTGIMGINDDIFVAVPYWVANSINQGDRNSSILGGNTVQILDKISYEGGSHGKHVILTMKFTALKDKNGRYYYQNQPLEVNKWFELRVGPVDERVYLTYLDKQPPESKKRKLRVTVKKTQELPYITENISAGDEMVNNKGEVMAKVINKSESAAELKTYTPNGELKTNFDPSTKDILLTVDILTNLHENIDYFGDIRKVRVGEKINLFFNKATLWDGVIFSVNES